MRIVFLGGPGAGKGTQASVFSEYYNVPHISTGELFRIHIKNETDLGLEIKNYMDNGMLCPDTITECMVKERLQEEDCRKGFILDGFPRTINQAECLDEILSELNVSLDVVINIKVADDVIIERISGRRVCSECGSTYHLIYNPSFVAGLCDKCGSCLSVRKDDDQATVKDRLMSYHKLTEPLVNHYRGMGLLIEVFGREKVEDTTAAIRNELTHTGISGK